MLVNICSNLSSSSSDSSSLTRNPSSESSALNNITTPRIPRCFTHFTLEIKCKVLEHLANVGNNISQCARDYGIDRKYISRWNKQKKEIIESTHKRTSFKVNNERRKGFWPLMETQLNEWILINRARGGCVTGAAIKLQASKLFKSIYMNRTNTQNFLASDGWFSNFLTRLF